MKNDNSSEKVFMDKQIEMIAERLRTARIISEKTASDMASVLEISTEEYVKYEDGEKDFSFTFLFKCAQALGLDISELVSGGDPKLNYYTVTRKGEGMPIKRRKGFEYRHLASLLKHRLSEPFVVRAVYDESQQDKPIMLSTHAGQELDYILEGSLKVRFEDHFEVLHEGDSIMYDSGHPHGMIAIGGKDCVFLAIVQKSEDAVVESDRFGDIIPAGEKGKYDDLIYHKFVDEELDENGGLKKISFKIPDHFNYAYDVVDELAKKIPDKRAMLWLSDDFEEKEFTFKDISLLTNKTANYLRSLGIEKGDRVMLVVKRHYQFWLSIIALHKIGAIVLPAPAMLMTKDYVYRFNAAGVSAIICTSDDGCPEQVDNALAESPTLKTRIIVGEDREGWDSFNKGIERQSDKFERVENHKNDTMLMFFTSGTTGYPKTVMHTFTYPLGHIVTARHWHRVEPDGIHLTIADTGWGKALWGKLYGQWLCESAVFVYDFDRFHADKILPLFKKYNITTFCAPPTMYRLFIKSDLDKYDFSSVKHVTIAGEALNPEVFEQFLKATGLKMMEGFGQTETTLSIANLCGRVPKPGSMGVPTPQYDIMLMRADGTEAAIGEEGEIVIKAEKYQVPGMFAGYYRDEESTNNAWHDGYYHTGDTAWKDEDGYFWYVGRVDDLIKSSGYRIGPFEIESVIMELPYVLECAVIGEPDEVRGQIVTAIIILVNGKEPSEELKKEIQEYVKKKTAPYKYPRKIEFVDSLPKTISGKIQRSVLRAKNKK